MTKGALDLIRRSIVIVGIIAALGCADTSASRALEVRMDSLTQAVDSIGKRVENQEFMLRFLQFDPHEKAIMDPVATEGYSIINTPAGSFAVAMRDQEEYGDGIRVTVDFGNLNAVNFLGGTIRVRWGPREPNYGDPDARSYSKWQEQLREREISFTETLQSAAWNPVRFVLPGTDRTAFGYLEIGLQVDRLSLTRR